MCCSCSTLLLLFLTLLVMANVGVGLAHITIGTRSLSGCQAEPLLPVAIIVNGSLCALLAVWGVWDAVRANNKWTGVPGEAERLMGPSPPDDACVKSMDAVRWLMNTAAVAWATLTLYLVLRMRTTLELAPNSCDAVFVSNSVILASMAVANVAVVSIVNVICYVVY